jgi:thioredoxin 1
MKPQSKQPKHQKEIVSDIPSRQDFHRLLSDNPGLVVIKFGAKWCQPCKIIAPVVNAFFVTSPSNVVCCDIDVDTSIDLYIYLKSKKMINGIPAILLYKQGNTTFIPDDSVVGRCITTSNRCFFSSLR